MRVSGSTRETLSRPVGRRPQSWARPTQRNSVWDRGVCILAHHRLISGRTKSVDFSSVRAMTIWDFTMKQLFVLGMISSLILVGLFLVGALISFGIFLVRSVTNKSAKVAGHFAAFSLFSAILCFLSLFSGYVAMGGGWHDEGRPINPLSSCWGPIGSVLLGVFMNWRYSSRSRQPP